MGADHQVLKQDMSNVVAEPDVLFAADEATVTITGTSLTTFIVVIDCFI